MIHGIGWQLRWKAILRRCERNRNNAFSRLLRKRRYSRSRLKRNQRFHGQSCGGQLQFTHQHGSQIGCKVGVNRVDAALHIQSHPETGRRYRRRHVVAIKFFMSERVRGESCGHIGATQFIRRRSGMTTGQQRETRHETSSEDSCCPVA